MPLVMQTRSSTGPYRRTVKSSGRRYEFQPGQVLEVPDEDLAELLERSPGMLTVVVPEERKGVIRRYRPVDYKPPSRDSHQNQSSPAPVGQPAPRRGKRKVRPSE